MARITLQRLSHSYLPDPKRPEDYALKEIDLAWEDGGAYALLGPSGCGKSTLLNIISGLVIPSGGKVFFDDREVTALPTDQRNIAQVFQFPVIYDTMTVYDNLAFPLRNRGASRDTVDRRVRQIAEMLEVEEMLGMKAAGLTPDNKQKISMGRGLVREDVAAIMFDEPLTVIDPHLKWKLRSKLKELHQRVGRTMIYVTHDQTEALTFADRVVVMQDGEVVQTGTPVELFERPQHTFVGHFIGSPGMNVLPAELRDGGAFFAGHHVPVAAAPKRGVEAHRVEIGVRPEFVRFAGADEEGAIPVSVTHVADAGRHRLIELDAAGHRIAMLAGDGVEVPEGGAAVRFQRERTRIYADGWLSEAAQ